MDHIEKHSVKYDDPKDLTTFQQSGMLWFVNKLLHPFSYALAVKYDSDTHVAVGLMLVTTDDPDGMVFSPVDDEEAQKRFAGWLHAGAQR